MQCCGKDMSGTEREQGEIVMEDAEKSLPTAQQEVVSRSCSFCILIIAVNIHIVIVALLCVPLFQEAVVKKKYGGMMPKKPPLISKVLSDVSFRAFVVYPEVSF